MHRRLHQMFGAALPLVATLLLFLVLAVGGGPACSVEVPEEMLDLIPGTPDTADGDVAGRDSVGPDLSVTDVPVAGDDGGLVDGCPEGSPCDDGDPCTVADLCRAGRCVGGGPAVCDDGDPCTDDTCAQDVGCVYTRRDDPSCRPPSPCPAPCDDGDPCTADSCDETVGACRYTPIIDCRACEPDEPPLPQCDDGNPRTEDTCRWEEQLGGSVCHHAPLPCGLTAEDCDDGDPCTQDEVAADCRCAYEEICE